MSIDNSYVTVKIQNSKFRNIKALEKAGVILVNEIDSLSIDNSNFQSFESPISGFMHSISSQMKLSITLSTFRCQTSITPKNYYLYLNSTNYNPVTSTYFYIQDAISSNLSQNTFSYCAVGTQGGVFYVQSTKLYDEGSTFNFNAATQGGVFYAQSSTISFVDSIFLSNQALKAGVISLNFDSYMYAYNTKFQGNSAITNGGVLQTSTESYFFVEKCKFMTNSATESSVLDSLGSDQHNNITFKDCVIEQNEAEKNTISFMHSQALIQGSQFNQNIALSRTKNIFCGFSKVYIENSRFQSQSYQSYSSAQNDEQTSGIFIYTIFDVKLYISGSQFLNAYAKQGGAIYVSGDSYIYIQSSLFQNNKVRLYGGAIYASGFKELQISKSTVFKDNIANGQGDDIYVTNSEDTVKIENTSFSSPQAQNSIYASGPSLILSYVNLSDVYNSNSQKGAGLLCSNCRSLTISFSNFKNLHSQEGGAIYIEETANNKRTSDSDGKYKISNSTFAQCVAQIGGALYIDNSQYLTIQSSSFLMNSAKFVTNSYDFSGSGGAIYFTCQKNDEQCRFYIKDKSNFQLNTADINGGAIYWDQLEPMFASDTYFFDNTANYYGNDLACFAQVLGTISQETFEDKMEQLGLNLNEYYLRALEGNYNISTTIDSLRSGGQIPLTYLAHIDKYGQIVGSDFNSKVRALVKTTSSSKSSIYQPIIEGDTSFETQGGMVVVNNLTFAGTPGQTYSITFTTDGVDLTKKSNQHYMTIMNKTDLNFEMNISLRECLIGEYFTTSGKCIQCESGTSYSLAKMTSPGTCSKCPTEKAYCNGGQNIGPKPGYWRKNNYTSNFIQCLLTDACLGMIPPDNNPIGSCSEGYQGILCADCQINFSRTDDYTCQACPDPTQNVIRISFIIFGVFCALIYLVRSTLLGAKDVNNVTSIYLKILLNHVQLILLTASFDFEWPEIVLEFFDVAKPVAQLSAQVFSFDCFLDTRESNEQQISGDDESNLFLGLRIIFQKLLMYALLPFIVAFFVFGFWYIYRVCKRNKIEVNNKAISTLIIILFLVHPNIVQFMFFNFKCLTIEDEERLQNDLEIICYNSVHKFFSYYIAIPSILVWGLGIPLFAFILLSKSRKQLDNEETREKFGFFYRGYRKEFYYWETVIMYRKILLIFISVFILTMGVVAQALIVFMVLIIFVIINTKKKPFSTIALNDLENMSLVTSMITVYCGLFFIADKPEDWIKSNPDYSFGSLHLNEWTKLVFFVVIVTSNLAFFIYWVYKIYLELKNKLRAMFPRLYLCVFLCNNHEKLSRQISQQRIDEENEHLREEYFRLLKSFKDIYFSGELVLNHRNLEKLMQYLSKDKVLEVAGGNQLTKNLELSEKQQRRNLRILLDQTRSQTFHKEKYSVPLGSDKSKAQFKNSFGYGFDDDQEDKKHQKLTHEDSSFYDLRQKDDKKESQLQIDSSIIEEDYKLKRKNVKIIFPKPEEFETEYQGDISRNEKINPSQKARSLNFNDDLSISSVRTDGMIKPQLTKIKSAIQGKSIFGLLGQKILQQKNEKRKKEKVLSNRSSWSKSSSPEKNNNKNGDMLRKQSTLAHMNSLAEQIHSLKKKQADERNMIVQQKALGFNKHNFVERKQRLNGIKEFFKKKILKKKKAKKSFAPQVSTQLNRVRDLFIDDSELKSPHESQDPHDKTTDRQCNDTTRPMIAPNATIITREITNNQKAPDMLFTNRSRMIDGSRVDLLHEVQSPLISQNSISVDRQQQNNPPNVKDVQTFSSIDSQVFRNQNMNNEEPLERSRSKRLFKMNQFLLDRDQLEDSKNIIDDFEDKST